VHDFAYLGAASGLRESNGADHVHRGIKWWICHGMADRDLGGEVKDDLRPNVCKKTVEVGLDDVSLDELEI
jgi:hypothetical protein